LWLYFFSQTQHTWKIFVFITPACITIFPLGFFFACKEGKRKKQRKRKRGRGERDKGQGTRDKKGVNQEMGGGREDKRARPNLR
jgi:hypothetical protein